MSFANTDDRDIDLITLGQEAVKEFEGTNSDFIEYLMNASGSGGVRPKLKWHYGLIYIINCYYGNNF
ncbi:hypothetical protein [Xenorhabdus sp. NBAII XenSa04]|nr:hypothetical protein [Xenorhabdus sp. NBAII XenSa04]MBC8946661.1 phosphatidylinositol kinase [Xenorhabdus indica]